MSKPIYFVMSGEGKTDLGQNNPDGFVAGAVFYLIDALHQKHYDCSLLDCQNFELFSESQLSDFRETNKGNRRIFLPSHKTPPLKLHALQTLFLALYAEQKQKKDNDIEIVPLFFRDADTPTQKDYDEKWHSMLDGFNRSELGKNRGIPMLAKPKSEAWFLCIADDYTHCKKYENDSSGNDDSPNSLKKQLESKLNGYSNQEICLFLESKGIDVNLLAAQSYSFNLFKERFETVLNLKHSSA